MSEEKPNKWTRPRGFWEVNGGDILMLFTALFFLAMTVAGVYVYVVQPTVPGLHALFSDPPLTSQPGPPPDQKLHLVPGETEIRLYPTKPGKPPEKKK